MNFLIINNGTSSLNEVVSLLEKNSFEVFDFDDKNIPTNLSRFDGVILTGGHRLFLKENFDKFSREMEIVSNSNLPIFGICFGFQLISVVFGSKMIDLDNLEKGIFKIEKINNDFLFNNVNELNVYENHQKVITDVSDDLIVLAKSKNGVEIIKHKDKMIYGVQFHPELCLDETCGYKIFGNFLKEVSK